MMKKLSVISLITAGFVLAGCSDVRREPGAVYMPDMAYSRAFETYAEKDSLLFTTDPGDPPEYIFLVLIAAYSPMEKPCYYCKSSYSR
ncbi:hypothetical protein ES708_30273 [subsurface metagenome]